MTRTHLFLALALLSACGGPSPAPLPDATITYPFGVVYDCTMDGSRTITQPDGSTDVFGVQNEAYTINVQTGSIVGLAQDVTADVVNDGTSSGLLLLDYASAAEGSLFTLTWPDASTLEFWSRDSTGALDAWTLEGTCTQVLP